jgi:hypothetical protein
LWEAQAGTRPLTLSSRDAATLANGFAYHGPPFWKAVADLNPAAVFFRCSYNAARGTKALTLPAR